MLNNINWDTIDRATYAIMHHLQYCMLSLESEFNCKCIAACIKANKNIVGIKFVYMLKDTQGTFYVTYGNDIERLIITHENATPELLDMLQMLEENCDK
jgi:nuclear transport factor 2 (NTF2) superfamily protein